MHRRIIGISLLGGVALAATSATAFEFRVRWVERQGNADIALLHDNFLRADSLGDVRVRLQFGVFDDAAGAAPAGGVLGWNVGSLVVNAPPNYSRESRTPGRLSPFNSSTHPNANGNPPLPGGDPFERLTEIDGTLGEQMRVWGFDGDGDPLPQPGPIIRGLNTWVSVFEITVNVDAPDVSYDIGATGNLISVNDWTVVGTPVPPDPDTQIPGFVTFAPVHGESQLFDFPLIVYSGPTPGAVTPFLFAAVCVMRRRR